jgi:hypothetical protein
VNRVANPNQDGRNKRTGRYVRTRETAERDARAAELFSDGLMYHEIGAELGLSKAGAYYAVQRAIRSVTQDAGTRALERRRQELQLLWESAMDVLESHHVVVSNGRVVELDGEPLTDHGPTLQAVESLRRINESLRKLDGTDQPTKVNVSGGVRYEVVGVDPEQLK